MLARMIIALMLGILVLPACQQDEPPPATESERPDNQDEQPPATEGARQEDQDEQLPTTNPSGVLVDEIRAGMTPAEVEGMFGAPEGRASIGEKVIYIYPNMKVTFTDGKVSDIE